MAVNNTDKNAFSFWKRLFLGTNVTLAVLLVVFLTIALNFLASKYNVHKDLSGGLTGHRLSDRTKRVLDKAGSITISTVYTSNDPERNYKEYLPKLRDFTDELARYSRGVTIQHVSSPDEQALLRERVSQKFGSATGSHKEATAQALAMWESLGQTIESQRQTLEAKMATSGFLKDFSSLAGQVGDMARLSKNLEDTTREVKDMVQGEGLLPRYSEANTKITTFNEEAQKELKELQTWARDMGKLIEQMSDPQSEFVKTTREHNQEITRMLAMLQQTVGDPKDTSIPDDPAPVLKKFGDVAKPLTDLLMEESGRVETFIKNNPPLRDYSKWVVQVEMMMGNVPVASLMPLPSILSQMAEDLSRETQQVRAYLSKETPKDRLQDKVRKLRQFGSVLGQYLGVWTQYSTAPFDEANRVDESTRKFLAGLGDEAAFKDLFKQMDELSAKIKALPEQKMDEVGKRLEQDNIIVVESQKEVRILPFDEVWPLVDRRAGEFTRKEDGERHRREFNGDSAIANALLDMQNDKPFGTVIFVAYETQPPPQMRQFQRPQTGPLPLDEFRFLRERLERANFAVKDWNLAAAPSSPDQPQQPADVPEPPAPVEGTEPIYVFLPPAEPQMNMMMMGPQKSFGEPELNKVRQVLDKPGAKAVFLALGAPRPPQAPPATYGYGELLENRWGIKVEQGYRVMRAVPSAKDPGMYSFDPIQFHYMRLNHFTDHPIGKPMRARRMLMLHACPVVKSADVPDVKFEPVLEVPAKAGDMWAEGDFQPIILALRERSRDTTFPRSANIKEPPFPVIAAAENSKTGSRVVVMGIGASLLENYLEAAVPRIDAKGEVRLVTDPPPTENVELFDNALLWLDGKADLIAAGPADVPFVGPIAESSKNRLWVMTMGWALLVLVLGGAVMFIRRR